MKSKILFSLIICLGWVLTAQSQVTDCHAFKNGKFKIYDPNAGGLFIIERKGDYQVESNDALKIKMQFTVTWLNDCNYTLKLDKVLRNENKMPIPEGMIVTVKIIKTNTNSYTQESSSNVSSLVLTSEVTRVE